MPYAIRLNENNEITAYHPHPEKLDEKQKEGTIIVDSIPEKEQKIGKRAVWKYNPDTGKVEVTYKDRPLTADEVQSQEGQAKIEDELLQDMIDRGII